MTFKKSFFIFCTNSEISRTLFMQSGDLTSWHHSLSEVELFGVIQDWWRNVICNNLFLSRCTLTRLPRPLGQSYMLVECISVARVRPRKFKEIIDLLLPLSSWNLKFHVPLRDCSQWNSFTQSFSRQRSRSLTELTRQITPPTKNGHAPPPIESRKSYQSVNPYYVWTW